VSPHQRALVLAIFVTPLVAAASLAIFAFWGVHRVDALAEQRERSLLQTAIEDRVDDFGKEQESVANWDDAVTYSRAHDQVWMEENLSVWIFEFYGHDQVAILDEFDRPIHARQSGDFPSGALEAALYDLERPIAELRQRIREGGDQAEWISLGLSKIGGRASIVAIRPILPDTDRVHLDPADAYLHVDIQFIDSGLVTAIGSKYGVANVRFQPLDTNISAGATFPIVGRSGELIGYVAWNPDRPGLRLVRETAPGLALFSIVLVILIRWLFLRLRRAARNLSASEAESIRLAFHDPLTGLPNRALMNGRLDFDLAELRTSGAPVSLLYLDLDRFKIVNDTLGHPAGDALICQVAGRLLAAVGADDLVARLGGDEFAIIRSRRADDVIDLAQNLLGLVKRPFSIDGNQVFIDVSIGIATARACSDTRTELQRKADIALYEAKAKGKGRACVFAPCLEEVVLYNRAVETDLRDALDTATGLFVLYQPQFGADGVSLRGAEALVRWDHPVHGMLSPTIFVPIAEERGLIHRLGMWVLDEALRTAKDVGLPSVAVNVSAVQFQGEAFEDRVLDLLRSYEISPERLQLEITEGLLLESAEPVARALTKLRFAGVQIALDDFGTGYSSLNYLRRYKVDKIKIDRSFVQQLSCPDNTDAIVRAMLEFARALHLEVTAEGVETETQWRWLVEAGCTEFQGFLFAEPLTVSDLRLICPGGLNPERPNDLGDFWDGLAASRTS
jgi:diguanylate cyclase (GGDEF)-like protein